jgi:hypothetical protein
MTKQTEPKVTIAPTVLLDLLSLSAKQQNQDLFKTKDYYILKEEIKPTTPDGKPEYDFQIFSTEKGIAPVLKEGQEIVQKFDGEKFSK